MAAIDTELYEALAVLSAFIDRRGKEVTKLQLSALRMARSSAEGVAAAIRAKGDADLARKRMLGDPEF